VLQARRIVGRDQRLWGAAAGKIAAGATRGSGAGLEVGKDRAQHPGLIGAGFLQTVERDFNVRVRGDGAVNQGIQLRILQSMPPGGELNGAGAADGVGATGLRRRRVVIRQRKLWWMIVRSHRAAGDEAGHSRREREYRQ
jgi:hypothetical protein